MMRTPVPVFKDVSLCENAEKEEKLNLDKMTVLEKTFTKLTISRTMMLFFACVFSIPFFIPTTYKPYASEYQPFMKMFDNLKGDSN